MKVRYTPPFIAQFVAALVLLISIAVALDFVFMATNLPSGGDWDSPPPWWGRYLIFCILPLLVTIPALGYKLTHQFFCWSYRGYGYPDRPSPIRFRHLILISFSTVTTGSNLLYWSLFAEEIWIPPYLESVLRFGMQESAAIAFVSAASLFLIARRTFWIGLSISVGSLVLYYLSPLPRQ